MPLTTESALRKDKTNVTAATFEHRHFAALAHMLDCEREHFESQEAWSAMCGRFADRLAATNPRFDRHRFLMACSISLLNAR